MSRGDRQVRFDARGNSVKPFGRGDIKALVKDGLTPSEAESALWMGTLDDVQKLLNMNGIDAVQELLEAGDFSEAVDGLTEIGVVGEDGDDRIGHGTTGDAWR